MKILLTVTQAKRYIQYAVEYFMVQFTQNVKTLIGIDKPLTKEDIELLLSVEGKEFLLNMKPTKVNNYNFSILRLFNLKIEPAATSPICNGEVDYIAKFKNVEESVTSVVKQTLQPNGNCFTKLGTCIHRNTYY